MSALVVAAVAAGAVAQSVSGIGFTLVSGPLLVAALGPSDGVRLSVVLSLVVNLAVLSRTARQARLREVALLLAPAVLATPLLVRLLRDAPERALQALAGAATLVGALVLATGVRWRAAGGRAGAVGAGVVSAAMNVVAGIGGPAVALYATNAGWPAAAMRSTGQAYFLVLNVVALAALGLPAVPTGLVLACLLALAVGLVAGALLAGRVPEAGARRATLALAGLGGLVVLLSACEQQQQQAGHGQGQQDARQAAEPVGEEEEHLLLMPAGGPVTPPPRPGPPRPGHAAGDPPGRPGTAS